MMGPIVLYTYAKKIRKIIRAVLEKRSNKKKLDQIYRAKIYIVMVQKVQFVISSEFEILLTKF